MAEIIAEGPQLVRLRTDLQLWKFFAEHKIFFGERGHANVPVLNIRRDCRIEEYASFDGGNLLMTMGAGSYQNSAHAVGEMGRYCSIADRVFAMGECHPIEHVTTSAFPYRPTGRPAFAKMRRDFGIGPETILPSVPHGRLPKLGHDVWIGDGAVLSRGIALGTGCIVATRAVVTKDVPPYAIVGGNPARLIRMRFPADIVAGLLALAWWDLHPSVLFKHDIRDPRRFIETAGQAKAETAPFSPAMLTCADILAAL